MSKKTDKRQINLFDNSPIEEDYSVTPPDVLKILNDNSEALDQAYLLVTHGTSIQEEVSITMKKRADGPHEQPIFGDPLGEYCEKKPYIAEFCDPYSMTSQNIGDLTKDFMNTGYAQDFDRQAELLDYVSRELSINPEFLDDKKSGLSTKYIWAKRFGKNVETLKLGSKAVNDLFRQVYVAAFDDVRTQVRDYYAKRVSPPSQT